MMIPDFASLIRATRASASITKTSLRPYCRQPWHGRKSGLAGIATHDGLALGIAQHVLDIVEAIGRQLLDCVDHALRTATAVRAHNLRRHRQSLLLVRHQRLAWTTPCASGPATTA